jgi:glyoxylase-like metal-dependent hydrolase (beta-lactamase superfamily II)
MADVVRYDVGSIRLHRVPYFDIPIDGSGFGLGRDVVETIEWRGPWASGDGLVRIGQAVWVIESGAAAIVVDPCGAADEYLRAGAGAIEHQLAVLAALDAAGFPADAVTGVFLSHLDGIGMAAAVTADGSWGPTFPHAPVMLTTPELDHIVSAPELTGVAALTALMGAGAVTAVEDGDTLARGVRVVLTAGHTPGHAVLRIESDGARAVFLGHLAVSPLHAALERCSSLHLDSVHAAEALDGLLAEAAADGGLLVGPLWPAPGAGYVSGPPWRISPA